MELLNMNLITHEYQEPLFQIRKAQVYDYIFWVNDNKDLSILCWLIASFNLSWGSQVT
jgi:hypothetical protein